MITQSWQLLPGEASLVEIAAPSRVMISADGVFYISLESPFVWGRSARIDGTLGLAHLPGVIREPFMIYSPPGGSDTVNVSVIITGEV
jgi:hypothetical protein